MKKLTLTLIASTLTAGVALAPISAQAAKINPWQHCGIGAIIFPDHGVASAISNIIFDLGTTAVISATASPETCNTNLVNTALLIDVAYDQLTMEVAQGSGEHLNAVLNLVGCATTEETVGELRSNLSNVVSLVNYAEMAHEDKAYSFYSNLENVAVSCGA